MTLLKPAPAPRSQTAELSIVGKPQDDVEGDHQNANHGQQRTDACKRGIVAHDPTVIAGAGRGESSLTANGGDRRADYLDDAKNRGGANLSTGRSIGKPV